MRSMAAGTVQTAFVEAWTDQSICRRLLQNCRLVILCPSRPAERYRGNGNSTSRNEPVSENQDGLNLSLMGIQRDLVESIQNAYEGSAGLN